MTINTHDSHPHLTTERLRHSADLHRRRADLHRQMAVLDDQLADLQQREDDGQ